MSDDFARLSHMTVRHLHTSLLAPGSSKAGMPKACETRANLGMRDQS